MFHMTRSQSFVIPNFGLLILFTNLRKQEKPAYHPFGPFDTRYRYCRKKLTLSSDLVSINSKGVRGLIYG